MFAYRLRLYGLHFNYFTYCTHATSRGTPLSRLNYRMGDRSKPGSMAGEGKPWNWKSIGLALSLARWNCVFRLLLQLFYIKFRVEFWQTSGPFPGNHIYIYICSCVYPFWGLMQRLLASWWCQWVRFRFGCTSVDDGWWRTFNPRRITKDADWEIIIILLGYCLGAMSDPRLELRFVNFHLFIAAASASASVSVTVCFIVWE